MSFAVGLLPVAKLEEWREFCASVADGDRAETHRDYLRSHGVTREHILHQATPMGDVAILIWEGMDQRGMEEVLGGIMTNPSTDYEKFLVTTVLGELHGVPQGAPPPPPLEVIATIEP